MKFQRGIASVLILVGILMCADSSAITGHVVANMSQTTGTVLGLALIIGGALLFMAGREESGKSGLTAILEERKLPKGQTPKSSAQYERLKESLGAEVEAEEEKRRLKAEAESAKYEIEKKLVGGKMNVLGYLEAKDILFEREYFNLYPQKEGESDKEKHKRQKYALEHQGKYPLVVKRVENIMYDLNESLGGLKNPDSRKELRRHADKNIREDYLKKIKEEMKKKGLKVPKSSEHDFFESEEYKNYRDKILGKINEWDKNVETGKWVYLGTAAVSPTNKPKLYGEEAYSQIAFFGPKEYLPNVKERLDKGKSIKKYLNKLAEKGKVGAAHMVAEKDKFKHLHWEGATVSRKYL